MIERVVLCSVKGHTPHTSHITERHKFYKMGLARERAAAAAAKQSSRSQGSPHKPELIGSAHARGTAATLVVALGVDGTARAETGIAASRCSAMRRRYARPKLGAASSKPRPSALLAIARAASGLVRNTAPRPLALKSCERRR